MRVRPIRDFHLHSTFSDGTPRPAALSRQAKQQGLQEIALCDHDVYQGVVPAGQTATNVGLGFLNGIELSTLFHDRVAHVLGLGFDVRDFAAHCELNERLTFIHQAMRQRVEQMCLATQQNPIRISTPQEPEVRISLSFKEINRFVQKSFEGIFAAGHFNLALIQTLTSRIPTINLDGLSLSSVFCTQKETALAAFEKQNPGMSLMANQELLGIYSSQKALVASSFFSLSEAVSLLLSLGALPGIAHPGEPANGINNEDFPEIIGTGIKFIEGYSPKHSAAQIAFYERIAQENALLLTGGSDYHGEDVTPDRQIGMLNSTTPLKSASIQEILARR